MFDVGLRVDLDTAAGRVGSSTRVQVTRTRRPAPTWFEYAVPPLGLTIQGTSVAVGNVVTEADIDVVIHDFGAVVVRYRIELPDRLDALPALSAALSEHAGLLEDARTHVARLVAAAGDAVEQPALHDAVEDYFVHVVRTWEPALPASELVEAQAPLIAGAIEGDADPLSAQQVRHATDGRLSYAPTDVAVIDWNGAVLFDDDPSDVLAVLQHANVELLEIRVLDQELDALLDQAEQTLGRVVRRPLWPSFHDRRMLEHYGVAQIEFTARRENVEHAVRLLGNQYLARLHRLAARQLDVRAWHDGVQRKLDALDGLYEKMADATATRRLETLEWVIIVLIAVGSLLPLLWKG